MIDIEHLLALARAYAAAEGVQLTTVSTRLFNDGKVLGRLEAGGDLTTGRFRNAVQWFSDHWPAAASWPAGVPRPPVSAPPDSDPAGPDAGGPPDEAR